VGRNETKVRHPLKSPRKKTGKKARYVKGVWKRGFPAVGKNRSRTIRTQKKKREKKKTVWGFAGKSLRKGNPKAQRAGTNRLQG